MTMQSQKLWHWRGRLDNQLCDWDREGGKAPTTHLSGPMGANHGRARRNPGSIAGAPRLGGPLSGSLAPGPEPVNFNAGYQLSPTQLVTRPLKGSAKCFSPTSSSEVTQSNSHSHRTNQLLSLTSTWAQEKCTHWCVKPLLHATWQISPRVGPREIKQKGGTSQRRCIFTTVPPKREPSFRLS